jgi:hypothetical protein
MDTQTFEKKIITDKERRNYPKLNAQELARKLSFKTETLTVFEIIDDELVEKKMKVANGVMFEVLPDETEKPANMNAMFHAGWALK